VKVGRCVPPQNPPHDPYPNPTLTPNTNPSRRLRQARMSRSLRPNANKGQVSRGGGKCSVPTTSSDGHLFTRDATPSETRRRSATPPHDAASLMPAHQLFPPNITPHCSKNNFSTVTKEDHRSTYAFKRVGWQERPRSYTSTYGSLKLSINDNDGAKLYTVRSLVSEEV